MDCYRGVQTVAVPRLGLCQTLHLQTSCRPAVDADGCAVHRAVSTLNASRGLKVSNSQRRSLLTRSHRSAALWFIE